MGTESVSGGHRAAASDGSVRLYELLVDRVLDIIKERRIHPGESLPAERELAADLKVSRNALRQAFGILEERGLIRTRRGAGRYLREVAAAGQSGSVDPATLEAASIADVLEARILLEEQVAVLACQRRTGEEARRLLEQADQLVSWEDNLVFHCGIAAATHNFMLERLVRQQASLLGELHQREHYGDDRELLRMRAEHHAIATAIAERDETAARALVRQHLDRTRRVIFPAADRSRSAPDADSGNGPR